MNPRVIGLTFIPCAGVILLVGTLLARHEHSSPGPKKRLAPVTCTSPVQALAQAPAPAIQIALAPSPAAAPAPAPAQTVAQAVDDASLNSRYQNFRTAVATGNQNLQQALLPSLARERATALRLAEEDLARATDAYDQDVAKKAVEALRR